MQAAYTGAVVGPGGVVVNGALAVSSGAYFVDSSTFPSAGKIFIGDGSPGQILSKNSDGALQWASSSAMGDNLGSHVATTTLNMANWDVVNVSSVNFKSNVFISSAAAAQLGGVYVSTNLFVAGVSSATAYYGDGSTLMNVSTNTLKIGDSYGGGIVFWVDSKGENSLIAAPADQPAVKWSNDNNKTGAGLDGIYAGKADTVMISTMQGPGTYAARLCADYAVTVNGVYYDDWYLPSKAELLLLYAQRGVVGGFSLGASYWSSTEYVSNTTGAWSVDWWNGYTGYSIKVNTYFVRCVRGGPVSAFDYSRDAETVRNGAYVNAAQTFTGANTFTSSVTVPSAGNIYVNDGSAGQILSKTGAGNLQWTSTSGLGDNLGNHIATTTLDMANFGIVNVASITATNFIRTSTLTVIAPSTAVSSLWVSTSATIPHLYVSTNGWVGLGTASPASVLDIKSNTNARILVANTAIDAPGNYANVYIAADPGWNTSGYMSATRTGTNYNGYVSFGSPYAPVIINSGSNGQPGTPGTYIAFKTAAVDNGSSERMRIDTVGNVGLSTGAPQARLDVLASGATPDVMAQLWRNSGGTVVSSVSATGVIMAAKFIGDGSALTNLTGASDNLGNHIATTTLNMATFNIVNVGSITANGSITTYSSMTVAGSAFSVGGSTLTVNSGKVGIGTDSPGYKLEVKDTGMAGFQVEPQNGYVSLRINGVEVAQMIP